MSSGLGTRLTAEAPEIRGVHANTHATRVQKAITNQIVYLFLVMPCTACSGSPTMQRILLVIILTRGMGERLTYTESRLAIVSSWWSVWEAYSSMEGAPVPEILFAGHSGLNRCESLVVGILFCVRFGRRALNRSVLLLVTAYLS